MIAILLATYNGEKYLKEQIDSILLQIDRVPEKCVLYVHDDGSTDRTCEILKEYVIGCPGKVKLLEGPPQGGSTKNFMFLLKEVEADYYMFSDQDDVWLPEKIERQYKEIKKLEERIQSDLPEWGSSSVPTDIKDNGGEEKLLSVIPGRGRYSDSGDMKESEPLEPEERTGSAAGEEYPALVFSDMKVVDEDLKVIEPSFYSYSNLNPHRTKLNELILENVVSGCCMMFNRRLRDMALRYNDLDKIRWHDWWITEIAAAVSGNDQSGIDNHKGESLFTKPENSGLEEGDGNRTKASTGTNQGPETTESSTSEPGLRVNRGPKKEKTGISYISYIPEPLMLYRQHGTNAVGATEDMSINRVTKKLSMILGGEQSEQTRKFIREAVDQAKQLLSLKDDISEDSYNIVKALADFDSQGKLQRIQSFRQLKIARDKRNLWMMLHL